MKILGIDISGLKKISIHLKLLNINYSDNRTLSINDSKYHRSAKSPALAKKATNFLN